jgi:hypothetical protein
MNPKTRVKYRDKISRVLPEMLDELKEAGIGVEECPDERFRLTLSESIKADWWPYSGTCREITGKFQFESFQWVNPIIDFAKELLSGEPEAKKPIAKRKLLRALDWQMQTHRRFAQKATGQQLKDILFHVDCLTEIRKIVECSSEEAVR